MSTKSKKPKSIKTKPEEEIKKDIEKIVFPSHSVTALPNTQDAQIKLAAGYTVQQIPANIFNFAGKILPFFYFRILDENSNLNTNTRQYFNDIKNRLKQALGIPQTIKKLSDIIEVIDRPQIENENNANWRQLVPRGKKLNRLKVVYEILIKFTLEMIHNFFWVDFIKPTMVNNVAASAEQITNIHNINHYIERVLPISLQLKKLLENEVELDYPNDIIDLQYSNNSKF